MSFYTKTQLLKELSSQKLIEGEGIEFKSQWNQSCGKSISAMGNQEHGGWLVIGVDDKGVLCDDKSLNWVQQESNVENHISQYLAPISSVHVSVEEVNHKKCILIEIINPQSIVSWNGKFYKRIGSRTEEMSSGEKQELELKRPGLDFSNFSYKGNINSSLVLDFAKFLKNGDNDWIKLSATEVLEKLAIEDKKVSGILFGDFTCRVAHYNHESELTDQEEKEGLYSLLTKDFIQHIQSWTRTKGISLIEGSLSVKEEEPYPASVLREAIVNAVAHSAFDKNGGEVTVELYQNRIRVSNYCSSKSTAFIDKKFSQGHFSYNPFLMKILRKAKFSEEFGTGKNKIFKHMIESGRREPIFEYQKISDSYGKWSVTLYNEQPNKNFLKLVEKFKNLYSDNSDKYKLSSALVLWKDKSLEEIFSYLDRYHRKLIVEILSKENSPFLLLSKSSKENQKKEELKIIFKRWVSVQLGGQESKIFSSGEEIEFKKILQDYAYKDNRNGYITNKEARTLFGLSDSQPERTQLSQLFKKWQKEKFIEKGNKRSDWRVTIPAQEIDWSLLGDLTGILDLKNGKK